MENNQDIGAVSRSQEFFRLKETVESSGQIFEINESAKAIYIGPDSDIAEVQVTYFNPDEPLGLETAVVSVNGPLVGRVDSLPVSLVPSTNQPARILVNPVDIVDNAYVPPTSLALRRFNIPAILDLMVALKPLPDIPSVRADRTLRFPQVPFNGNTGSPPLDGSTDLLVPIYGRRMVTVVVVARQALDVALSLVNLLPGSATVPRQLGTFQIAASVPPSNRVRAAVIRASDAARQGMNLSLGFAPASYYVESDQPPDPNQGAFAASPTPRGLADLLLVNLKPTNGAANLTQFADVFIKLSDRET